MDVKATLDLKMENAPQSATPSQPPAKPHRPWFRHLTTQLLTCALILGLAYATFQLVTHYVLQAVEVVGVSMAPTLHDSERYVMNRLVYRFREPRPTDIVVLRDPSDNGYAIKRIVAKQGDLVYVKDGHLFVNGKLLDEPYLPERTPTYAAPKFREQMWVCGVNQYFVLGDNRNNSADSRVYGTVPRQNILGLVNP